MAYCVYIVTNRPRGVLYVGVTNDLGERISAHKSGGGSKFAKRYNCTRLVWFQRFDQVLEAITFEKRLKRWLREWKIELIEKSNPSWEELLAY